MIVLKETIGNLAVVVLINSFVELLLPSGTLHRFVRLLMGLLVLLVILNPVLKLFNGSDWGSLYDSSDYADQTADVLAKGDALAQTLSEDANDDYRQQLEQQIKSLALVNINVQQAEVKVELDSTSGQVKQVTVSLVAIDSAVCQKVRSTIAGFMAIDEGIISCSLVDAVDINKDKEDVSSGE